MNEEDAMAEATTIHIERYFTCMDYLKERFDRLSRQMGFRATKLEDAVAWQHELRARVSDLLGLDTMLRCSPDARVTERVECDGYVRERVEIQTEPGVIMPTYVFLPAGLRSGERRPVVLAPHGHGSAGKFATAGRRDIPALRQTIEQHNYDYGVQLVKAGFVVFCPDARGFGERRESTVQGDGEGVFLSSSCQQISHMALPLGQTVTGMWAWDLMRLIDYASQRSECDASRLGCAGLSGGGLQTLYLSALDERVKCAVTSGYFYGVKESLLVLSGNCACNYVPNLWKLADMGDLGALIAPRPLCIETGTQDGLNGERGVANVVEQVEITRAAYKVFGAPERLLHHVFEGGHRWSGEKAIPWLKRWLEL
jgi:dienelactone hydrolase